MKTKTRTHSAPRVGGLKQLRLLLGVTQRDLARAAGIQQSEVSRLERRDDYYVSTLQRVVRALGGHLVVAARFGRKQVRFEP
jgi:predicted transcriptional regulator